MKKLIIPLNIISKIGLDGERELLISNGFNPAVPIHTERNMAEFRNVYTQEDNSK